MYAGIDMQASAIFEGSTPTYAFQLVNELGDNVLLGQLATATLTYYDYPSGTILNTRQAQDILNANDVTIGPSGLVTWTLQPEDTTRVSATNALATHEAVFTFTYDQDGDTRTSLVKAWWFVKAGILVAP